MTTSVLLRHVMILVAIWLTLSLLALVTGPYLMDLLSLWIAVIANQVLDGFHTRIALVPGDGDAQIQMIAIALDRYRVVDDVWLPVGAEIRAATNLSHALVPLVILVTVAIAWPGRLELRVRRFLAALPMIALVSSLTTPFLLAGKVQMFLMDLAARNGSQRDGGLLVEWLIFTETGGRWLLPLLLAAAIILAVNRSEPSARRSMW